jgi:hypothetical protein
MGEHLTREEIKSGYIDMMGDDLGAQFYSLFNECVWLHLKWNDYVALFGTDQSRFDLMNASAPSFFSVLDDTMWRDLLLHLCVLTDESEVGRRGKRQTLTIRRLPMLVDDAIKEEVKRLVVVAVNKTEFARDWRNRHIAHRDLNLVLKEGAKPLHDASRQHVREAITAIVAVLGAVEKHYRNATTGYEYSWHPGDATTLLRVLKDGVDAQRRRFQV